MYSTFENGQRYTFVQIQNAKSVLMCGAWGPLNAPPEHRPWMAEIEKVNLLTVTCIEVISGGESRFQDSEGYFWRISFLDEEHLVPEGNTPDRLAWSYHFVDSRALMAAVTELRSDPANKPDGFAQHAAFHFHLSKLLAAH